MQLASGGKAQLPITVSEQANEATKSAAARLADYLARISGAKFEVASGDGTVGIALGRAADFPKLQLKVPWDENDVTRREDYLLRSHERGLHLLGATSQAVEHAMWDLLHRLGYRQFFPGKHWEVVPKTADLRIEVDAHEHPSWLARRIWYGFGAADYATQPYADWCAKNRAVAGIALRSGHAYDGILHRNQAAFAAHPEYLGLVRARGNRASFASPILACGSS